MKVLEARETFELDDERVWVCGDWHGNVAYVQRLLPAMRRADSSVRTLLHLGDWWMDSKPVDYWAEKAGLERVLVTLGNHEPWNVYSELLAAYPGQAVRVSDVVWLLPRPYRFTIRGRKVLSLGGAASLDRIWRTESVDWWPHEQITDGQVEAAVGGGAADLMLTHESPDNTPVAEVRALLEAAPAGVPWAALAESAASRHQVDRVWSAIDPALLLHGHMHVWGSGATTTGRRVVSLNRDHGPGNTVLLRIADLATTRLNGDERY